jgi:CRP-like cAMP-binding protein
MHASSLLLQPHLYPARQASADVYATEPSTLLVVLRAQMLQILGASPALHSILLLQVRRRLPAPNRFCTHHLVLLWLLSMLTL